jgi:hypothetical protein
MAGNPPRKHDKELGKLEPWIRRLKNKINFHRWQTASILGRVKRNQDDALWGRIES